MRRRSVFLSLTAAAGILAISVGLASPQAAPRMRDLFNALSQLMPYAIDQQRWDSPANTEEIEAGLAELAAYASAIQHHGLGLNESYGRARDALAADAREALTTFRSGEQHISRYIVRNITEDCFACHSRLPAHGVAGLGEILAGSMDLNDLDPAERLRLLVATRQFDAAMTAAEEIMVDEQIHAADVDLMGVFEAYLKISVRVNRDFERPRTALWTFLQRSDIPLYLVDLAQDWIAALEEFGRAPLPVDLRLATDLLREANNRNEYLRDRRGLVHAVVASSLLHQFVQTNPEDSVALSEAYYRLGVAEASISRTIWIPETEYFLERAIRAEPTCSHAMNSYTFLEQYVLSSYTGSAGTNLPDDVWDRLAELRELVEAQGSEADQQGR